MRFGRAGKFTEQPEACVVHVGDHNRTARDTDRQGRHLRTGVVQLFNHRHHQANRRQTSDRGGTLNDAHRRCQHEASHGNRQAHSGQRFAQSRANAGIHQHLLEHTARTDHQQNNPRRLQRRAADFHHAVFRHPLTHRQAVDRHQTRHQNRGERMADKLKPFVGIRPDRHKACGDGFQAHQH
ncbi:hypothetical protein D3C71_1690930 [compost metagenome]